MVNNDSAKTEFYAGDGKWHEEVRLIQIYEQCLSCMEYKNTFQLAGAVATTTEELIRKALDAGATAFSSRVLSGLNSNRDSKYYDPDHQLCWVQVRAEKREWLQ